MSFPPPGMHGPEGSTQGQLVLRVATQSSLVSLVSNKTARRAVVGAPPLLRLADLGVLR